MVASKFIPIAVVGSACAFMLFASDFWKSKDASVWTDEEINKMLSDSPWAKAKTVQPQQQQTARRGMGRRGGFGFPGGGVGGYPGGGYPGGGYPGRGRNNGDPSQSEPQREPMNLTIRWASAAPIQQALMRQNAASDELKSLQESSQKYYVISVLGLRMPRGGQRRSTTVDADNPDDNGNDNANDRGRGNSRQNDALRSQLLDAAQLAPKGKSSIYAQDVQIEGPGGIDGVRFLFPRSTPIAAGDKEVDFILD